jgi:intracellular sulfur oxidation DsrE/DsrF family protein
MKTFKIALLLFTACWTTWASGQGKAPYQVVIDVTSPDTLVHKMAMRWVSEIIDSHPEAQVEVVFFGKSMAMITRDQSTVAASVEKYARNKNVAFRVCEVALKNNNLEKSQLIDGVGTVPDGIYEVISKQHEGWGYIKAAR